MKMTEIHASFEKRVTDGNFGGECVRVEMTGQLESIDDPMVCVETLLMQARFRVLADLAASQNANVRRQVQPPISRATAPADAEDGLEELPEFEAVRS